MNENDPEIPLYTWIDLIQPSQSATKKEVIIDAVIRKSKTLVSR